MGKKLPDGKVVDNGYPAGGVVLQVEVSGVNVLVGAG
jgi:hypothetical protein